MFCYWSIGAILKRAANAKTGNSFFIFLYFWDIHFGS